VLRQPYGRKTGISDLDESYVYCFRGRSRAALAAVRAGLQREGLGELGGRVVVEEAQDDAADPGHVDVVVRPQHQQHAGRVYLPCFVVPDAQGGFREVRYEIDVLSRVDWSRIDLRVFDRLALNPAAQQDRYVRIGIDEALPGLRASGAVDMAIDLPFITRQLGEIVPSPWLAYELAGEAIARLRARPGYDDARIRRDSGLVVAELKQLLKQQRDRLAEEAFRGLVERGELRFYLLSSDATRAVPDRIMAHASSHRLAAEANAPLQCTALERGQHEGISPRQFPCPHPGSEGMHCSNQRAVALYLDRQQWVLAWYRNVARAGYSIQGWQAHSAGPDVVAFAGEAAHDPAAPRLSTVYVLETKGLHLNNDATSYKHELCQLCNELSQPTPYDLIARQFSGHNIYFQVIFEDEWRRVINAMLKVEG
jgi:type III restriction enzyme